MNTDNSVKDKMVAPSPTRNKEMVFVIPSILQMSSTQGSSVVSGSFQFRVYSGGSSNGKKSNVNIGKQTSAKGTKEPTKNPVKKKRSYKKKRIQEEDKEDGHKLTKEFRECLKRQIEEYRLEKMDAAI
jgi:hypothetical protein